MRTICYFSSYFELDQIPYYIRFYLKELSSHCEKVIFITNSKQLDAGSLLFLKDTGVEPLFVKNEGWDFGMWAKCMVHHPPEGYDRLVLVNDSCILFRSLDSVFNRLESEAWEFAGILDSFQIQYHIQSYFWMVDKKAFALLQDYFNMHPVGQSIQEVIRTYEVGLSVYMQEHGMRIGSVYSCSVCSKQLNAAYSGIEPLIIDGFPMIKKKIIFGTFRKSEYFALSSIGFRLTPGYYLKMMKKAVKEEKGDFDFTLFEEDIKRYFNQFRNAYYSLFASLIRFVKKIPGLRKAIKLIFGK
ncbi:MAG: rhamnan synthesis F family protein [Bacteroidia bacterium]